VPSPVRWLRLRLADALVAGDCSDEDTSESARTCHPPRCHPGAGRVPVARTLGRGDEQCLTEPASGVCRDLAQELASDPYARGPSARARRHQIQSDLNARPVEPVLPGRVVSPRGHSWRRRNVRRSARSTRRRGYITPPKASNPDETLGFCAISHPGEDRFPSYVCPSCWRVLFVYAAAQYLGISRCRSGKAASS
jgi:hypothetical protein